MTMTIQPLLNVPLPFTSMDHKGQRSNDQLKKNKSTVARPGAASDPLPAPKVSTRSIPDSNHEIRPADVPPSRRSNSQAHEPHDQPKHPVHVSTADGVG